MTGGIEYKLWLDNQPVDATFYTMIETITVEQGIDLACEARVEVEMCADENGAWSGPTDSYVSPWKRLRLEVRNQTSAWVPLIDGPVVSWDANMSGEPGQSTFSLIARDDTDAMNQVARIATYEDKTDGELLKKILTDAGFKDLDLVIDKIPAQPQDRPAKFIQRGTDIEMLRSIADPYDLHVYVMPDKVGKSKAFVTRLRLDGTPDAPTLVMNGADRNVETFQARNDVSQATRYQFETLDIATVQVGNDTLTTKWSDADVDSVDPPIKRVGPIVQLLGAQSTVDNLKKLGTQILSPYVSAFRDVVEVGARAQQRSSYTITATGSVRYGCYDGVLRAYDVVTVSGVNAKLCTKYIVREVTHTLSRSEYRQDFTLMTNSVAKVDQSKVAVPAGIV
jgi:hypothetical protein